MTTDKEKKPCDDRALVDRKFSQQRAERLLKMIREFVEISRVAPASLDHELLIEYRKVESALDALVICEAKYQEKTLQHVQPKL